MHVGGFIPTLDKLNILFTVSLLFNSINTPQGISTDGLHF